MRKTVLVVAGASGSGKSTLVRHLLERYSDLFILSVSYTTRTPRTTETHGKEYYFISKDEFQKKERNEEFLECAEYADNMYGTGIEALQMNPEHILILEIEKKGVESVKRKNINAVYLYIHTDIEELKNRILRRAPISEEELKKRLLKAEEENKYGASGEFDIVLNNVSIAETKKTLEHAITQYFPEYFSNNTKDSINPVNY
ncbi:guanylate kinase [Nematocida sp. LUAm3]|nr:guanylate kinase [Nematocida sp. LUAm3]KAI5176396.1 guanylate kinase [Nematocida sp. LUAm2]KAI5179315.1 guanylate kinase [Nematocida sp. LUAm1]